MKISIVGGGNMGGAIARGLSTCDLFRPQDITVINRRASKTAEIQGFNPELQAVTGDYSSLATADIVVIAVKPWMVEALIKEHLTGKRPDRQIVISVAAGISLEQLQTWAGKDRALYCAIPNTAIEVKQSMTFITGLNATEDQNRLVLNIFGALGKAELVEERLLGPATTLCSCGIAFAFRYIRAAMEGGVELGLYPQKAHTPEWTAARTNSGTAAQRASSMAIKWVSALPGSRIVMFIVVPPPYIWIQWNAYFAGILGQG